MKNEFLKKCCIPSRVNFLIKFECHGPLMKVKHKRTVVPAFQNNQNRVPLNSGSIHRVINEGLGWSKDYELRTPKRKFAVTFSVPSALKITLKGVDKMIFTKC